MAQVVTLERYRPVARYDATAWTNARIEEAVAAEGPWVALETIAISPVDTDPENPASRNFTTELADDAAGLWYRIVFVDATGDESLPTEPVQNSVPSNLYVSLFELKGTIEGLGASDEWDDELFECAEAASRAIDGYMKRTASAGPFYPTAGQVRLYDVPAGALDVRIHDLAALTTLTLDFDGDGTFETTWTEGTEFLLDPSGADLDGYPFTTLTLTTTGGRFPRYPRSIKVTGTFGWSDTPAVVRKAARLLATRLFKRRETPYAILSVVAAEAVAAAHLGRIDPDVAFLLDSLPGVSRPTLRSLQLG